MIQFDAHMCKWSDFTKILSGCSHKNNSAAWLHLSWQAFCFAWFEAWPPHKSMTLHSMNWNTWLQLQHGSPLCSSIGSPECSLAHGSFSWPQPPCLTLAHPGLDLLDLACPCSLSFGLAWHCSYCLGLAQLIEWCNWKQSEPRSHQIRKVFVIFHFYFSGPLPNNNIMVSRWQQRKENLLVGYLLEIWLKPKQLCDLFSSGW